MRQAKGVSENPIIDEVRDIVRSAPGGLSEYDLLSRLQVANSAFDDQQVGGRLSLFRRHFLVMNALYRLQAEFLENGQYLSVSPLMIRLAPATVSDREQLLCAGSAEHKLREYYLDLSHIENTSESEVDDMLNGFWQRYLANDKRIDAFKTLGLPHESDMQTVKNTYRRLASEHHPDKGGDSGRFRAIREAYEVLVQSGLK